MRRMRRRERAREVDESGERDVRVSDPSLDFDSSSKRMDGLDSDRVLEVPNTPDRMAIRQPSSERNNFRWDANPNCNPLRRSSTDRSRHSCHHNLIGNSSAANDAEFLFREANEAWQLSNNVEGKDSSQPQSEPLEPRCSTFRSRKTIYLSSPSTVSNSTRSLSENVITTPYSTEDKEIEEINGKNAGLKPRDKGKGIDLCSNSKFRNGSISSCSVGNANITSEVGSQNVSSSTDGAMLSSSTHASDNGKRIDFSRTFFNELPQRPRTGQRKLVRNGCISPLNIERSRNSVKQKEVEVGNNGSFCHQVHIISPDSQERNPNKLKGGVTAEDIVADSDEYLRPHLSSGRPGKEVTIFTDVEGGSCRFEDKGWRTTRNHMGKSLHSSLKNEDAMVNGSSTNALVVYPEVTALQRGTDSILPQDFQELQSVNGRIKGKRKLGSSHFPVGECSSSTSNDPNVLYLGSSRQAVHSRSTKHRRSQRDELVLGPVIEIDELQSPEAPSNPIHSDRQVESDEMLARELQEELYNEIPAVGNTDEIDSGLAMLLQENDIARQHPSRRRDSSSSSARTRVRQARGPRSSRMAELRRSFQRSMMDFNMRFDIIGAVFGDDGDDAARLNNILHSQRDFNENDYEMLLALDENNSNQHGGASESQINNLPLSTVQNADSEEACAVCLEPPAIGETIRHLPCLHKFHKECIDAWLRRKGSCPICKSDIR